MSLGPDDCCGDESGLLDAGLGDAAATLATEGFTALWHGRPAHPGDLLTDTEMAAGLLSALVERGRAEVDELGRLTGIHGLTLGRTRHSIEHAGHTHHTWCAFDAVGIPAALGITATARTDCPACGQELAVELNAGIPARLPFVVWLPGGDCADLRADFCAHADMYCSPDHLARHIDTTNIAGNALDLADAASLGRGTWADVASGREPKDRT